MAAERGNVAEKVASIFRELAGDRADRLNGSRYAAEAMEKLQAGLSERYVEPIAFDVAFHLADWNNDAAFLVAVHLFPERFTPEEIEEGAIQFLIHAPNHVAAAAKLSGNPIMDVFEVGPLLADEE